MDDKEKDVQKALGTLPEFTCPRCGKLSLIDEKFIYTDGEHSHLSGVSMCIICATAQFVCNRVFKRPEGHWDKEKFDK